MSLGPLMIDLQGCDLQAEESGLLQHPLVGGVILFARNFHSVEQLQKLVVDIHAVREPRLLVAVDHEGGRIQRFREGFSKLPPAALIGRTYDQDNRRGLLLAESAGWLMAVELRAVDIDFSFAPVLDIQKGVSNVIGDRAFHRDPQVVARLARAYINGMKRAGMAAVGKHFPGHGSVVEDSHHDVPVDNRRFEDIQQDDLVAFERLIHAGIAAIMPAHVIYPAVDDRPAGFSPVWLKQILRKQYGFQGTLFSDDISMSGAEIAGDYPARTDSALRAGCDMVLVCNNREAVLNILDNYPFNPDPVSQVRLIRMHGKQSYNLSDLQADREWQQVSSTVSEVDITPELDLGDDAT